ncbi:hypothetical protein ETAA1_38700 [Urbifossiella limnaea]|uniref:Uncharacterized protein n=2 Tax=Urbifossiella limnaea TaxID=2528023 RepID=A0A517XWM1_9BACT|nr:hypothetical protein ETAA1_38700 [Urbifossiella limnaea]
MTTPVFLDWLEGKFAGTRKVPPGAQVVTAELEQKVRDELIRWLTEEAVRAARVQDHVAATIAARQAELVVAAESIAATLPDLLDTLENRTRSWKAAVWDSTSGLLV